MITEYIICFTDNLFTINRVFGKLNVSISMVKENINRFI